MARRRVGATFGGVTPTMTDSHPSPSPESVVREFWSLMGTNDFALLAKVLSTELLVEWPQTNELIRGPTNYIRMNQEYPSHGPWVFAVERLVAAGREVVTHVRVTDGVQRAEALSFFEVGDGKIVRLVEFWPQEYTASSNRSHLVEPLRPAQESAA